MPSFYVSEPDGEPDATGGVTPHPVDLTGGTETTYRRVQDGGTDLREATRRLETHYRGRRFESEPTDAPFEYSYVLAGDDRLVLQTSSFSAPMRGEIPFPGQYIVAWNRSGRTTLHQRGHTFTSEGATPFLMPAEEAFSFESTPRKNSMVQLGTAFLEQTAAERHGGPSQRIVFDYAVTPRPEAVAAWRATVGSSAAAVVAEQASPIMRLEAQLALARALLDLFPWRAVDVPVGLRTQEAARVRHAVEYIHAHAAEPLTPADIAAASGMHTRTLQTSMKEHLGTSPAAYLRQVRLDRARDELLAAAPAETRVSDVARRWGFGNFGRFAGAYAERFDEYPRDTLAR
ncbi:helix-turn-helix transcriptional regulator [Frigoribacterium sp. VKM Ac-1396]|uniref:helix-turn-helix transcriptional regulator n=1 Tax=Frigoribacterium sp. VKM Ac-1396 TaxID=2783821 RepID=UPI00188D3B46|nr:helix-turn-helix transcriptional regulator [Frigoribacterium sp. VKM Ac-1396]MBF4600510.1 helix-turn-helix transcriptional regulator [Frigoribacterium sp. VKM Ac-1396]